MKSVRTAAQSVGINQPQLDVRDLAARWHVPEPISLLDLLEAFVTPQGDVLVLGLTHSQYEARFLQLRDTQRLMPIWLDAYQVDGENFFNAIWSPSDGVSWIAKNDMTASQYQSEYDAHEQNGYRLTNLRSYRDGAADGSSLYAAIWRKEPGPALRAFHGKTVAEHQELFESWTQEGYIPVNLSVVHLGSVRKVSGFYVKRDVGSFVALPVIEWGEVEVEVAKNRKAGRHLVYLTSWKTVSVESAYSAIFWENAPGDGDTSLSFEVFHESFDETVNWHTKQNSYLTRCLTGAEQGSGDEGWHHGYSAVWRRP